MMYTDVPSCVVTQYDAHNHDDKIVLTIDPHISNSDCCLNSQ